MKRNLVIIGCLALFALTSACNRGGSKKVEENEQTNKVLVKTSPAFMMEVDQTEDFTSTIQAYKENNISPSFAVRIDKIYVEVGDRVKQGQLLVRMDPTQYNQANVQLNNLEADFERIKNVYEAGGISKQQLDQAETQYRVQKDQVTNLLDNIELRSPISGVVTERNYDPGDMYGGNPVLKVMQIDRLKVNVNISEIYFPLVKVGMPAEIFVDSYGDRVFNGTISLVYPAIDAATRTFTVEISIPNADHTLRPGMFSRTRLNFGMAEQVVVNDLAVQRQLGSSEKYVYVARNGTAERRLVTTGRQVGDNIVILTGVEAGEEIVVAGISKLVNGSELEINNN